MTMPQLRIDPKTRELMPPRSVITPFKINFLRGTKIPGTGAQISEDTDVWGLGKASPQDHEDSETVFEGSPFFLNLLSNSSQQLPGGELRVRRFNRSRPSSRPQPETISPQPLISELPKSETDTTNFDVKNSSSQETLDITHTCLEPMEMGGDHHFGGPEPMPQHEDVLKSEDPPKPVLKRRGRKPKPKEPLHPPKSVKQREPSCEEPQEKPKKLTKSQELKSKTIVFEDGTVFIPSSDSSESSPDDGDFKTNLHGHVPTPKKRKRKPHPVVRLDDVGKTEERRPLKPLSKRQPTGRPRGRPPKKKITTDVKPDVSCHSSPKNDTIQDYDSTDTPMIDLREPVQKPSPSPKKSNSKAKEENCLPEQEIPDPTTPNQSPIISPPKPSVKPREKVVVVKTCPLAPDLVDSEESSESSDEGYSVRKKFSIKDKGVLSSLQVAERFYRDYVVLKEQVITNDDISRFMKAIEKLNTEDDAQAMAKILHQLNEPLISPNVVLESNEISTIAWSTLIAYAVARFYIMSIDYPT